MSKTQLIKDLEELVHEWKETADDMEETAPVSAFNLNLYIKAIKNILSLHQPKEEPNEREI